MYVVFLMFIWAVAIALVALMLLVVSVLRLLGILPPRRRKGAVEQDKAGQIGQLGEELIGEELERLAFFMGEGKVLRNAYVPKEGGGTSEVDVLFITSRGVFVIESKNYSGWIFGNESDRNWTQCLKGGQRNRFYNPIRQNRAHIKWLGRYVGGGVPLYSLVVFSERCELKKITVESAGVSVIKRGELEPTVRRIWEAAESAGPVDVEGVYRLLEPLTHADAAARAAHLEEARAAAARSTRQAERPERNLRQTDSGEATAARGLESATGSCPDGAAPGGAAPGGAAPDECALVGAVFVDRPAAAAVETTAPVPAPESAPDFNFATNLGMGAEQAPSADRTLAEAAVSAAASTSVAAQGEQRTQRASIQESGTVHMPAAETAAVPGVGVAPEVATAQGTRPAPDARAAPGVGAARKTGAEPDAGVAQEVGAEPEVGTTQDAGAVSSAGSPLCPRCGKPLVVRTAKRGANADNQFYGCSGYPSCRYTRSL